MPPSPALAARAKYAPNFSLLTAMGQVTAGAIRNPAAASAGVPWRRSRHFLWPALAVIERCAVDLPELHEFYVQRRRRGHQLLFGKYVAERVASGHFAAFSDPQVAAQLAIETITWFAWHRVEGFDRAIYDDHGETGRRTVTDFVCNALINPAAAADTQ